MNRTFGSSLVWRLCLLIVLSVGLFAWGGHRLVLQPAINELAQSQMGGVAQKLQGNIQYTLDSVETTLRTGRSWGEISQAQPSVEFLTQFTSVFIPIITQNPQISSVIFADETGREILLLNPAKGPLVTRISDPDRTGDTKEWWTWDAKGQRLSREQRQIPYDARTRPWFQGVMAQASPEPIFWTKPYTFFTSREPGVTAAMRWTAPNGKRYVIGLDVALLGLSRFTSGLQVGQHGVAALLDSDGIQLAVPRSSATRTDAELSAAALKPANQVTGSVLAAGYDQWRTDGNPSRAITRFDFQGAQWLSWFEPTQVAGRAAWLATFAPADEFLPTGPRVVSMLLAITLAAVAIACWVALGVARRIARPLEVLTRASERMGRLELQSELTLDDDLSKWAEVKQLGQALNTMRQRLLDAATTLDRNRQDLEDRVAERTNELARQVTLIEALLDTIPNAIFYKGADTRFLGCNQAYETIFGIHRSQFIGKTVLDLEYLPLDMRQVFQAEDIRVVQECSRISRDEELTLADGMVHNTLYSVTGFRNEDGSPGGLIGVIVDVTELKTAERAAVKASHAAQAASDAKAMFLANMSHEIRTPMNAILGLTHLVLQMELPQRQRSHLEKVNTAALGLLRLINDILDFSKIEAGKMTCEIAEFSLDAVNAQVVDVLSMRARDKGLELLFDVASDVPDRLMGDAVRLGQVLINLVSNAIKFTDKGEITLSIVCLAKDLNQTVLRFEVQDTGVGMTEEECAKVFSAFTQADSSTTRRFGGTGLGLSISQHIVELMGGKISVQSVPAQGSVFRFDVAFGAVIQSELTENDGAALDLQGLRALIVDDNAAAQLVFGHILEGQGLRTQTANHGQDALTELQRAQTAGEPYQLLILDWKMAGLDGVVTLRQLQAQLGSDAPLCIMATAYDPDTLREELGSTEVAAIVQKPITGKLLMEAIRAALQGRSPQAPNSVRPESSFNLVALRRLLGGTHVLLVEDNPTNQELALEFLNEVGVSADVAEDGAQALEMLQQKAYALVLMDCQMPVMDGFEATRRIRAQPQWTDLPVIAMTAGAMEGERERCLNAGMNDYLSKPIDLGLFYSKLVYWTPRVERPEGLLATAAAEALPSPPVFKPGLLDEAGALARTNGNVDLYERLLVKFGERESDAHTRLDVALRTGDRDAALRTVHNLKGLAATIGATALSKACLGLEKELNMPSHAPDSVVQAKQHWQTELTNVLEYLNARLAVTPLSSQGPPPVVDTPIPLPDALVRCQDLNDMLITNNARASRTAEQLALFFEGSPHAEAAREVARQANRFDYDAAYASLQSLMGRLN